MNSKPVSPIFLFSSPRAGSTLLQRVLSAHPAIASAAEPWLLLAPMMALRSEASTAIYSARTAQLGLTDFCAQLPGGEDKYLKEIGEFATRLYSALCQKGEHYFLDKTPRYYLIIDEIVRAFPHAKFVFLFRNPLNVAASIFNTWGGGRLRHLYLNRIDLELAPRCLAQGYQQLGDRAHALRYEDFTQQPEASFKDLCRYLGIAEQPKLLDQFRDISLPGQMGDPARHNGEDIRTTHADSWQSSFAGSVRKLWLKRYLHRLDESDLALMGYDLTELSHSVGALEAGRLNANIRDMLDLAHSSVLETLRDRLSPRGLSIAKQRRYYRE